MDKIAKLKRSGPSPVVEVIIGQAQVGTYDIRIWDDERKNPEDVGSGISWDDISDTHPIKYSVAKLEGRFLSWHIVVDSPTGLDGELYSVVVLVRQDGDVVEGGFFQRTGVLDGTKAIVGIRKLETL